MKRKIKTMRHAKRNLLSPNRFQASKKTVFVRKNEKEIQKNAARKTGPPILPNSFEHQKQMVFVRKNEKEIQKNTARKRGPPVPPNGFEHQKKPIL